ncbi:putative quinol monooxygenase [Microbacterium ureisolvens]|uniref:Antibiotic biosynthesis monooxygenase n=1 Tax=Microbacterium ureisolvens TaxID=2781186 RepID=A0ABS7I1I1_9MICO|nr:putative quinol monooxygenase [Microbacterium ureisolvens]MBW9110690.1 antibiotic biosynthesis monooxygenase [Microbacterium ureisolvens]
MAENTEAAVVVTVFTPRPEGKGELIEALREYLPEVHREEGCLLYAIHDAENGTIVLIEKWSSHAHLDRHNESPGLAELDRRVAPFLAAPTTWTTMNPLLTELGPAAAL